MYQFYLPESMYDLDSAMNLEKLLWYYESGSTLTGKVFRIHNQSQRLDVCLGNGIIAKMPFEEATIYPIFRDGGLSPDVYSLVGKMVQVKITKMKNLHRIYVSRKENMQEVLVNIKDNKVFDFAEITAYSKKTTFIDVGGGIKGKIAPFYFSPIKFNDVQDLEISTGTILPVSVLGYDEKNSRFTLSRIFDSSDTLFLDQYVNTKIFDPIGDGIGYYCLTNNSIRGIIDSPNCTLHYGDNVVAKVRVISEKGLKLTFIRNLNF